MALDLDTARFGMDLRLPDSEDTAILETAAGDVPHVSGRACLRQALRMRIFGNPGELLHRPDYGCGLVRFVEQPMTPSMRARLASTIRSGLLGDPRIADCSVTVSTGAPGQASRSGALTIEITYRPADDSEVDAFTVEHQG